MAYHSLVAAGRAIVANASRRPAVLLVAAVLITLAAWHGVFWGSFQYDDYPNILRDPGTYDLSELRSRFATGIRPLLRLSYFLDHQIWGMHAPGFLATNLVLHLIAVSVIFALARGRLGNDLAAAAAAIAFAVQPAHAEVVAYVSGRSTGLSATMLLLALLFYERPAAFGNPDPHGSILKAPAMAVSLAGASSARAWRIGSFILWISACQVKETALMFPLLLVAWEFTRPEPTTGAGKRLLPFLATLPLIGLGLLAVPRMRELIDFSLTFRSPLESLAWNAVALPETLSLWVRPWALSVEHAQPVWSPVRAAAGGLLILALGGLAVAQRRRAPHFALAVLFALIALLPTHSLLAKLDPVTEKPLYLAWAGVAMLTGALVLRHTRKPLILALLAMAFLGGAIFSAKRVAVWQNPVLLWSEAVASAPESARAWNNLGMARFARDDLDGADRAFARALEIDPGHPQAFDARLTIRLLKETNRGPPAVEPQ